MEKPRIAGDGWDDCHVAGAVSGEDGAFKVLNDDPIFGDRLAERMSEIPIAFVIAIPVQKCVGNTVTRGCVERGPGVRGPFGDAAVGSVRPKGGRPPIATATGPFAIAASCPDGRLQLLGPDWFERH